MTEPSDEARYAAWAAGDRRAGEQLVARLLPYVARYFANKVAATADVEDLTAQTFEELAKGLGRFRGEAGVRSYVYGIAHNVLRGYLRRFGAAEVVALEEAAIATLLPTASERVAAAREHRLLLAALRAIPLHSQIVLELSYFEGLGRFEIADLLGVPPGTIASRLRRGRVQLESQLAALAGSPHELETTRRGLAGWIDGIRAAVGDGDA